MGAALLEVAVVDPRDVAGAVEGGADRLYLTGPAAGPDEALSPEPATVTAVVRESDLPVLVLLRLSESATTTGGELARLVGLARDYLARGASGVSFAFLDADLEVDVEVCTHLAEALPDVPWTFGRGIDASLDLRRSWRRLAGLPGLAGIRSAGSPRGLVAGFDDLLEIAAADRAWAALTIAGGGLVAEQVPWLLRAGVCQFHLDAQGRPGSSPKAYVDARLVRSWRLLLDDASERAARSAG
jgi:copper homeostasis protein